MIVGILRKMRHVISSVYKALAYLFVNNCHFNTLIVKNLFSNAAFSNENSKHIRLNGSWLITKSKLNRCG